MIESPDGKNKMDEYQYTKDWFLHNTKKVWDQLIPQINPTRILEIGTYEGASVCYLIDLFSKSKSIEIHCIDTWEGGIEHQTGGTAESNMSDVEQRFLYNTNISLSNASNKATLICHKGYSDKELIKLLSEDKQGYFDFIYVDGSHQAPDVLCDAILSFKLLRKNGVIAFDDYLWSEITPYGIDPIRSPKVAIDAFTNIFCRKIRILSSPIHQLYMQKISD